MSGGPYRLVQRSGKQVNSSTDYDGTADDSFALKPRVFLRENERENLVTVTFGLPGISKDDVEINLHDGKLTVFAKTKQLSRHIGYSIRERRVAKFSSTLQVPQGVLEGHIKAAMDNGVLTVTFPKSVPVNEH